MYLLNFLVTLLLITEQGCAQVVTKSYCEELEDFVPESLENSLPDCELYRAQCKSKTVCTDCAISDMLVSTVACMDGCIYVWESQGQSYAVQRTIRNSLSYFASKVYDYASRFEFTKGMTGFYEIQRSSSGVCFAWLNDISCSCETKSCGSLFEGFQVDCTEIEGGILFDSCNYQTPEPDINNLKAMELLLAIPTFACSVSNPPSQDNDSTSEENVSPVVNNTVVKPSDDNSLETTECNYECNTAVYDSVECDIGYIRNLYNNGHDYNDLWDECHHDACCADDISLCCTLDFETSDCRFCSNTFMANFVYCPSGYVPNTTLVGNYYSRLYPSCDFSICCTNDLTSTDCCTPEDQQTVDDTVTNPPTTLAPSSSAIVAPLNSENECYKYCKETLWTNVVCFNSVPVCELIGNFTDSDGSCSYYACCAANVNECCLPNTFLIPGMGPSCSLPTPLPGMPINMVSFEKLTVPVPPSSIENNYYETPAPTSTIKTTAPNNSSENNGSETSALTSNTTPSNVINVGITAAILFVIATVFI